MTQPEVRQPPLILDDAAAYTGLTPRFLRAEVQRGRLAVIRPGRFLRFRIEDLDWYLDERRVPADETPLPGAPSTDQPTILDHGDQQ